MVNHHIDIAKNKASLKLKGFIAAYAWFDLRNFTEFVVCQKANQTARLLNIYYLTLEKHALAFGGKIINDLGDGVGVLFRGRDNANRAFNMAKSFMNSFQNNNNFPLSLGVGIDAGKVFSAKNSKLKMIGNFHTGPTIIKAFRVSSLLSKLKENVLVTQNIYSQLNKNQKKELKRFNSKKLKGFSKKTNLYYWQPTSK